jgi:hypothetical protein
MGRTACTEPQCLYKSVVYRHLLLEPYPDQIPVPPPMTPAKKIQFLPYGRSIRSWICLTHKTYTCHTVQNTIRYDIRFTGMKVRYTIFERVTMYNNAKLTLRKLQWFISTVILL